MPGSRASRMSSWLVGLAALAWSGVVQAQQPAAAPSNSGNVPRAAYITMMDAEFARRDADRDGKISRAELEQFEMAAAAAALQAQNRQAFAQLDKDGNGALSPAEFAVLAAKPATPDVTPQLTRLDTNRDSQVTLIEYRAATLAGFDRLDTDLDGVVTPAEMKAGNIPPRQ